MNQSNLTFNVLTFDHPAKEYTFWFYKEDGEGLQRFYHTKVPKEVIEHFGEQEHFYTSFDEKREGGLPIARLSRPVYKPTARKNGEEIRAKDKSAAFSGSMIKRFYIHRMEGYFRELGVLLRNNFVEDIEVWLPENNSNSRFHIFNKYALKVQFGEVSGKPELLVTYEGSSKIFRESIAELDNVPPDCYKWVLYDKRLFLYEDLSEAGRRNLSRVYPVFNFDLRDALHLPTEAPDGTNPYIKFRDHIRRFFDTYINKEAFKKIIPVNCGNFITVDKSKIGRTAENSNVLLFGEKNKGIVPHRGIDQWGPYGFSETNRIQFFFIYPRIHRAKAELLHSFFKEGMTSKDGSIRYFKGMGYYLGIPYHTAERFSIGFNSIDDPLPEVESELNKRVFKDGYRYIAVYVSPHSKENASGEQKRIYYRIKETLLKRNITSQAIEVQKIKNDRNFSYILVNIAVAVLAKLNGVPWRLHVAEKRELIVGIGAFKSSTSGVQYIGSAFSFSNTGRLHNFDCFMKNELDELAGSILRAVHDYIAVQGSVSRVIIHFYKQMSAREMDVIEESLFRVGSEKIPVFIVSVNKTESRDIVAFDEKWAGLMPVSGTFIHIGRGRYLLFNNTRYVNGSVSSSDGFPFPIKLTLKCTDPELLKDYRTVKELLDQVYQFSRMYWKSVRQQNLPVTIKYPEMVAEIVPHFDGCILPEFGKDNLWFL